MKTISLCMIVKNEEKVLKRCLDSVKDLVEEIIIVDTGSTDRTKEIALKYTNQVYDFEWINDFSAARNYCYQKAKKDFILWLDADDVIEELDRKKFLDFKKLEEDFDLYYFKYHVGFDVDGKVNFEYYRERLTRRNCHFIWHEPVHEYLNAFGKYQLIDIAITHKKLEFKKTTRNLEIYEEQIRKKQELTSRGLFYYAQELYEHQRYNEAVQKFKLFLNRKDAYVEDQISACFYSSICYKALNQWDEAFKIALESFYYANPRSHLCCEIGDYYLSKGEENKAIFWFELATTIKKEPNSLGFSYLEYSNFIPYLQLVVCYYKVKNFEKAQYYHNLTKDLKPNHLSVLYNNQFFNSQTN